MRRYLAAAENGSDQKMRTYYHIHAFEHSRVDRDESHFVTG